MQEHAAEIEFHLAGVDVTREGFDRAGEGGMAGEQGKQGGQEAAHRRLQRW